MLPQLLYFTSLLLVHSLFYHKILHSSPAIPTDCLNPLRRSDSSFIGNQYFHETLTDNGAISSLDKFTFMIWYYGDGNTNNRFGRDIIFAFVDGFSRVPYVNLMVYFQSDASKLYIHLSTGDYDAPPFLSIQVPNTGNLDDLAYFWSHLTVSIDQSSEHTYTNVKLFNSRTYETLFNQKVFLHQTLILTQLSKQTRITNERFKGQDIDLRACGYLANFEFIFGWAMMDIEKIVLPLAQIQFYLKPFYGELTNLISSSVALRKGDGVYYLDPIGLQVYHNTLIEYAINPLENFVLQFWMKSSIQRDLQIVSLMQDNMIQTSLGFAVSQSGYLQIVQKFQRGNIAAIPQNIWINIIAQALQIPRDSSFQGDFGKLVSIYVDGVQVSEQLLALLPFRRLVIGQVFQDVQAANDFVALQEVRLFSGAGIYQGTGTNCAYFLGFQNPYCLLCSTTGHYCLENQSPSMTNFYLCPAGLQYDAANKICIKNSINNCLREENSACSVCSQGYSLNSNTCILDEVALMVQKQPCKQNAFSCNLSIINGQLVQMAVICQEGYRFNAVTNTCILPNQSDQLLLQCLQEYELGCFACEVPYFVQVIDSNGTRECRADCSISDPSLYGISLLFQGEGKCIKYCQSELTHFSYSCDIPSVIAICQPQCSFTTNAQKICIGDSQFIEDSGSSYTQSCAFVTQSDGTLTTFVKVLPCSSNCKICYHGDYNNCLECHAGYFYSRYDSQCWESCKRNSPLPYSNKIDYSCVDRCPEATFVYNYQCLTQCPQDTYPFMNECYGTLPRGTYLGPDSVIYNCPSLCARCSNPTVCDNCIGKYPIDGTRCVLTCYPKWLDDVSNTCVSACQATDFKFDYTASTENVRVCFQQSCGFVLASSSYQTVRHQTSLNTCVRQCSAGYFADYANKVCSICSQNCLTCSGRSSLCTSCQTGLFLDGSGCYSSCNTKYSNFVSKRCEGGCSVGYTITDTLIKACVANCGDIYTSYQYLYRMQCLKTPPTKRVFCDSNNDCFDCNYQCLTCFGTAANQCSSCEYKYLLNNECVSICPVLYDTINMQCVSSCPSKLKLQGQKCLRFCIGMTYEYKNVCYNSQPLYTYSVTQDTYFSTYDCHPYCSSCYGSSYSQCYSCQPGYYFNSPKCSSSCGSKFKNPADYTCVTFCPALVEKGVCIDACSQGYQNINGFCTQVSCQTGYYKQGNKCFQCNSACVNCTGPSSSDCSSCENNTYLAYSQCVSTCPYPIIYYNDVNMICDSKCRSNHYLLVNQLSQLHCVSSCPNYSYQRRCFTTCPSRTFPNTNNECKVCSVGCKTCIGSLSNQCTSCNSGLYMSNNQCLYICPSTQPYSYLDLQVCYETCPSNLFTFISGKICFQSCPSFLYQYLIIPPKLCVENCPPGSYISDSQCLACSNKCSHCYNQLDSTCLKCNSGYFLDQTTCGTFCPILYDMVNNQCVLLCPSDLFMLDEGGLKKCISQCSPGQRIYNQFCLNSCPQGTYESSSKCFDCHSYCLSCVGSLASQCTSCNVGYFLNGSTCVVACPNPLWADTVNRQCVFSCPPLLYIHQSANQCVQACAPTQLKHFDAYQKYCLSSCLYGYYPNLNQCMRCPTQCEKCSSESVCSICSSGYYLDVDQCVALCSQGLYMDPINKRCQSKCPSNLYHIIISGRAFCLQTCPINTFYYGDSCINACPAGMFSDQYFVCQLCPLECLTCTSLTVCTSCQDGYFATSSGTCDNFCGIQLYDEELNSCLDFCAPDKYQLKGYCLKACPMTPIFYFQVPSLGICALDCPTNTYRDEQNCFTCNASCASCNGPLDTDCISCPEGYFKFESTCSQTCPLGYLMSVPNMFCQLTCNLNHFFDSQSCLQACPMFSHENKCVVECPASTYLASGNKCLPCPSVCSSCNEYECISCVTGYYLFNGVCNTQCPSLYNDILRECVESCPVGSLAHINSCVSTCPSSFYALDKSCVNHCPLGTYESDITQQCTKCAERCLRCSSAACFQCSQGYYLLGSSCVVECPLSTPMADETTGVCSTKCSEFTYSLGKKCVQICPKKIFKRFCVDECPDGYFNDSCIQCRPECKTCTSYLDCTSCNSGFFLTKQKCKEECPVGLKKNRLTWECTANCKNALEYEDGCYEICPLGTFPFMSQCLMSCPLGYYQGLSSCSACPHSCRSCSSESNCSACNFGYFFFNNKCLDLCPSGLYGNPQNQNCESSCPPSMYQLQESCVFSCPMGFLTSRKSCVFSCPTNQYPSGKECVDCAIECKSCNGPTNNDCFECQSGYTRNDKSCLGPCPTGYLQTESQCVRCEFKCKSCASSTSECTKCRGDRQGNDCLCQEGYFDDRSSENCKKCPCVACTAENNCTKCLNNLIVPLCTCTRYASAEWCISCTVAKTEIHFSDDMNQIIVNFGYYITVDLINPFDPSDCKLWFENSNLGDQAQCYISWNRQAITIELGESAGILEGDRIVFKQNMFKDINEEPCEEFISLFIGDDVKRPKNLIKPFVEFRVPHLVSSCMEVWLNQTSMWGTGSRSLKIYKITLEDLADQDHLYELEQSLRSTKQNNIYFPVRSLRPSTNYTITISYVNFLNQVNSTIVTFGTIGQQLPYVYLTFNPLMIRTYLYDCHVLNNDLEGPFDVNVLILNAQNTSLYAINFQTSQILQQTIDESMLPKNEALKFLATTAGFEGSLNFVLQQLRFEVKFLQPNRFMGTYIKINARAYDPNKFDEVGSTLNFTYSWLCTNLCNLGPCKTKSNKIITFPTERVLETYVDESNNTYAFYVKVQKAGQWKVSHHLIVATELNIQHEFLVNTTKVPTKINPNDDIFIFLKSIQTYGMILSKHKLVGIVYINGKSLAFKLNQFSSEYKGGVQIYILPSQQSLVFDVASTSNQNANLTVTPQRGTNMEYFTIALEIQEPELYTYSFYYYLSEIEYKNDLANNSIANAGFLITQSNKTSINTKLPNGLNEDKIFLVCLYADLNGAQRRLEKTVIVSQANSNFTFYLSNMASEPSLEQMTIQLKSLSYEQRQVCLQQCSGVGRCLNNKCDCPPGYFFDDCSGSKEDKERYDLFMISQLKTLFSYQISETEQIKPFLSSLSELMKTQVVWDQFSESNGNILLTQLLRYTEEKINVMSQLQLNLEMKQKNEFKYDAFGASQHISVESLKLGMQCLELVSSLIIDKKISNKYEIEYSMRKAIENIVDLTFFTMLPGQSVNYSSSAQKVVLSRSQNYTQAIKGRYLSQEKEYFDVVEQIFISNYYVNDGYFKYPASPYPLYDYQVRFYNRKTIVQLQEPLNHTFVRQNNDRQLVCIQRDHTTFEWNTINCQTITKYPAVVCKCFKLAPTTVVDDKEHHYTSSDSSGHYFPDLIIPLLGLQASFILLYLLWLCQQKHMLVPLKSVSNQISNYKFGLVNGIQKSEMKINIWQLKQQNLSEDQANHFYTQIGTMNEIHSDRELQAPQPRKIPTFFERLVGSNFLVELCTTEKNNLPKWFRLLLIAQRWSCLITSTGLLVYYTLIEEGLYFLIMFGVLIVLRSLEIQQKKLEKYLRFIKSTGLEAIIVFLYALLMVLCHLVSVAIWLQRKINELWVSNHINQTFVYLIIFMFDLLALDFAVFFIVYTIGSTSKQRLAKKVNQITKTQRLAHNLPVETQ